MEKGIYKHIEQILRDYPDIDDYVRERRQALMYPHNENPDENIGGGRSNIPNNPVENMVITIADDRQLAALEKNKEVITDCLNCMDEDTKAIVEEIYFKKHPTLTMVGIAEKQHLSLATAKRKRTDFFEKIRKEFGW